MPSIGRSTGTDHGKSRELAWILMAVILGFVLRMASARYALVGDNVLFYGYDSFYHMRRVLHTGSFSAHFMV